MKRSPGPTPCSPLSISSAASAPSSSCCTRPRHARGERVARALDAGQVDEHELDVVAALVHAADRPARRLRPVGDDRHLLADDGVDERRLADVGPPGERDEAAAGHRRARGREQLVLQREHLAVVGLVVHAEQVQHAVDDRLAQVGGVLGADHDVAELAVRGAARRRRSAPPRRRRSGTRARRSARLCRGARALSSAIRAARRRTRRRRARCSTPRLAAASSHRRATSSGRGRAGREALAEDLDVEHRRSGAADRAGGRRRPLGSCARRVALASARRRPRRSAARACGARRPRRRSARTRRPRSRRARRRRRSAPTAARAAGRPA